MEHRMIAAHRIVSASAGEDCVQWEVRSGHGVFVLADGAGGSGGGFEAALMVCERVHARGFEAGVDWVQVLREVDEAIELDHDAGFATAVVVEVRDGFVRGASVGDSGAWLDIAVIVARW